MKGIQWTRKIRKLLKHSKKVETIRISKNCLLVANSLIYGACLRIAPSNYLYGAIFAVNFHGVAVMDLRSEPAYARY